jgi:hypothetical protein
MIVWLRNTGKIAIRVGFDTSFIEMRRIRFVYCTNEKTEELRHTSNEDF